MSGYNFKAMQPVLTSSDMIDAVLSKTTRKTPSQIHPNFKISRIRKFYMDKVKFLSSTIHERITRILDDFPRLDVSAYSVAQSSGKVFRRNAKPSLHSLPRISTRSTLT